ncbi:MAG: hypothetical protein JXA69_05545 [Phycisphaerae bacterium]|nr:hypothetical protein [Phycisphaerae bacterium]
MANRRKGIRSAFFRDAVRLKKDPLRQHLSGICELSQAQTTILLKHLPAIFSGATGRDKARATQTLAETVGGDAEHILQIVSVLEFLADQWDVYEDRAEDVLCDIREVGLLPETKAQCARIERFLKRFFRFLEKDSERRRRQRATSSVLPFLLRVDSAVDYRAVFQTAFNWSEDDPNRYSPSCQEVVPVILLKFVLSGNDHPIIFQCEPRDLEMTIGRLRAVQREYQKSQMLF